MSIKLFVTGGTIDKKYNELTGELIFTETSLPEMLKQSRCQVPISVETIILKDSLEMNDADRVMILEKCLSCAESQIIITHGTDTMTETAHVLGQSVTDKTIVLLGAMVPYAFKKSDSLFNLGCAVISVQTNLPGIYITMNGKLFNWDNVKKDRAAGVFQTVS